MQIIINRKELRKSAIAGSLYIDGQYICDTAENAQTALPSGKYRIVRHFCKQLKRQMPLLVSGSVNCSHCHPLEEVSLNTVMPKYCPMLKPGNGVYGRNDGSILLGTQIVPGCLSNPIQAFAPLAERIRKAIKRNKVITLVIQTTEGRTDLEYIK